MRPLSPGFEHPDAIHLPDGHELHLPSVPHPHVHSASCTSTARTLVYIYHRLHTDHFCTILSFCSLDVQGVFSHSHFNSLQKCFFPLWQSSSTWQPRSSFLISTCGSSRLHPALVLWFSLLTRGNLQWADVDVSLSIVSLPHSNISAHSTLFSHSMLILAPG